MCRLFGFRSLVQSQVQQSLVHADNALLRQSEKHSDGWGVAYYQADVPHIMKSSQAAYDDGLYRRTAALVSSRTVLAHIRKATAGEPSFANTHPFQHGRWVFAHNGRIENFNALRPLILARIAPSLRAHILGETDSECFFFLILTQLARRIDLYAKTARLQEMAAAAQQAIEDISQLTGGMNEETLLTFLLTDGVNMLAHQGGKELHMHAFRDRHQHCINFASEPPHSENHWEALPFGAMVGVDRHLQVHHGLEQRAPASRFPLYLDALVAAQD